MPSNDPGRYVKRGDPSSGLKKPKKVKIPATTVRPIRESETESALKKRLKKEAKRRADARKT